MDLALDQHVNCRPRFTTVPCSTSFRVFMSQFETLIVFEDAVLAILLSATLKKKKIGENSSFPQFHINYLYWLATTLLPIFVVSLANLKHVPKMQYSKCMLRCPRIFTTLTGIDLTKLWGFPHLQQMLLSLLLGKRILTSMHHKSLPTHVRTTAFPGLQDDGHGHHRTQQRLSPDTETSSQETRISR